MRALRWTLLSLYIALIGALFGIAMWPEGSWFPVVLLGVTLTALAIFILGAGRRDLCRPIRRPRLLFPVVASGFMAAILLSGLTWALAELFRVDDQGGGEWLIWCLLGGTWLFWSVVLFVYTRNLSRFQTIFQLARLVFVGSLAELLAAVPSHIFVTKRGGCFAGIATGLGIMAGLFVMVWSFGPAIFLLFLHEARTPDRRRQLPAKPPGRFQFSLRTLLLLMLATGLISGLLRAFWDRWPAAMFGGAMSLVLLTLLLLARPWLRVAAWLVVAAGLIYTNWGEWAQFSVALLPLGLYAILLVKLFADPAPSDPQEPGENAGG